MATAATEQPSAPAFPDYMLDPDAVIKDNAAWRHDTAPDYSTTRKVWEQEKRSSHAPGSLESLVENLVKNWEVEASHKKNISEWRTIDPAKYTFAINGGPPQDAEHMLKVGTYSAIIAPNQFYGPEHTSLEKSHDTFRNMMPNFAWEVLEVYSGPPTVAFKWRHWGMMKNDYVGSNDKGDTVTIKAHNEALDIQGVTVAKVNDKLQVTSLETWFDPVELFNQMRPSKETMQVVNMVLNDEAPVDMADADGRIVLDDGEVIVQLENKENNNDTTSTTTTSAASAASCPFGFTQT